MTLLDDARRLLEDPCQSRGCSYCGARMQQTGPYGYAGWCHLLTCPLHRIRVQRLVAALEAAEALSEFNGKLSFIGGFPGSGELCRLIQALTAALKGEEDR